MLTPSNADEPMRSQDIVVAPSLAQYTPARVGLTRTGTSIATRHTLEFALAHAQARDAVYSTLDIPALTQFLITRRLEPIAIQSAAVDRIQYLRRPDLGRTLQIDPPGLFSRNPSSAGAASGESVSGHATHLSLILADGLSAQAINRHAIPLLDALLPLLDHTWHLTRIVLAQQARVALGDPIAAALHAEATVTLIGERPGLSSPDSLGAYITWNPRPGCTDAQRNCVSNIRTEGVDYSTAAAKIHWYLTEGRRLNLTGINIRELDLAALPRLKD